MTLTTKYQNLLAELEAEIKLVQARLWITRVLGIPMDLATQAEVTTRLRRAAAQSLELENLAKGTSAPEPSRS